MLPGVGVFGTSLTARVIIPLLKDEGFAVKALWGRTQEEAEELAKEMSVPFYTSRIDEVLLHQDVDLVCINLPPPLTRQIAVKTLGSLPARCLKASELGSSLPFLAGMVSLTFCIQISTSSQPAFGFLELGEASPRDGRLLWDGDEGCGVSLSFDGAACASCPDLFGVLSSVPFATPAS
uniref:Gfo/Idh/MocA-like oxidoreductase N-terminal domain-containing protein n=1 Tax=Felis catus TaxID=9685 RepID=A0ABI7Y4M0_FELCA